MIKLLFSSSLLKMGVVLLNLLIPAIIIRFYSEYDFGIYSYLLTYAIVISVLQNGITASFRNLISNLEKNDLLDYLLYSVRKITYPFLLIIFCLLLATLYVVGFDTLYGKICFFIAVSLINIYYPVVASYYDATGKTLNFVLLEIIFLLVFIAGVGILIYYKVSIYIVCILTANYRGVYAILLIKKKCVIFKQIRLKKKGGYKIFCSDDMIFIIIQLINVSNTLLFMNMFAKFYGVVAFGVFSVYYRFVAFPQQVISFSSSLIWINFRQVHVNNRVAAMQLLKRLFFIFTLLLIIWGGCVHFFIDKVVYLYSSKPLEYPGVLCFLNIMVCLMLLKDFSSIILNALTLYKEQMIMNALLCLLNVIFFFFYNETNFDTIYLIFVSLLTLMFVFVNLSLIRSRL
ncbi:polysaccharide biosynthesis protein [Escherichia coli]|nr:polysaccharide biosynthesis protein [Escherichia coli]